MAKTSKRPAEQMYERLFSNPGPYTDLQTYLSEGGSVFPLVEKGVHGLVTDYRMSREDAQVFLRQASSMAICIRRRFIEHSMTAATCQAPGTGSSSELTSMVDGPTFEKLFCPDFDGFCSPNALESRWSPVAYLVELSLWIISRIEPVGTIEQKYFLDSRRSDLNKLLLDYDAVYHRVSAVDIIIHVLETFITKHGEASDLTTALTMARYPNDLPYFQDWVTLDSIAGHLAMSMGNFVHMADRDFPYFLQEKSWGAEAGRALVHSSRLGPFQRTLLTENRADYAERVAFFAANFGCDDVDKYTDVNQIRFLGERTGLNRFDVEYLLSIQAYAPKRSANVVFDTVSPENPESERFGSVYINAAKSPSIGISELAAASQKLTLDPDVSADFERFDRLNRKVRLDKWLGLRSHEVDALLVAAIHAEVRGGATAADWWITDNVVHALGLFQLLRERYGCTALDFAAFIDEMPVYGIGEELSLFDQVFNRRGDYSRPLMLDNGEFLAMPDSNGTDLTVNQICDGLQIDLLTYGYLAGAIANAQETGENLKRSAAVFSAFYRLTALARMLGVTPVEVVLMLTLLGKKIWLDGLAGLPVINAIPGEKPDVLNIIFALHSCVDWCKGRNLSVLGMLQLVAEPQANETASDNELEFFDKVANLLPAALLTNAGFLNAEVPMTFVGDWLKLLGSLADDRGLILDFAGSESEYLINARARLDQAVKDGLPDMAEEPRAAIVEKMLVVLLQARGAQVSVVKEELAALVSLDPERALSVLIWAGTTVYKLLQQVTERIGLNLPDTQGTRYAELDPLLKTLANMHRLSGVVTALGLSAKVLLDYLDYGYEAWGLQSSKYEFSMGTLYYLTVFTRALEMSEQSEQELLSYLRAVDNVADEISGDSLWLAQEAGYIKLARFFRWSVQEVRECVTHIDPSLKILKNLHQLDVFMRMRTLAEQTGMNARTIILLGKLPADADMGAYAAAAENALLSESETQVRDLQFIDSAEQLVCRTVDVHDTEIVASAVNTKTTYTVKLTNAVNVALKGVEVYWQASLGTIETLQTDENGEIEAVFKPGNVQGADTPSFWVNMLEPVNAPEIRVVADAKSLFFPGPLKAESPLGSVEPGEEVQLYAGLQDVFANVGANQLVEWSAVAVKRDEGKVAVIRPSGQAFTDQNGQTKVFIRAPEGGTFNVLVRSQGSDQGAYFEPITFLPPS